MGRKTTIEWTRDPDTGVEGASWNPVTGCTPVGDGCLRCYASNIAHRFAGTPAYPNGFEVTLRPERLLQPLTWSRPSRIFTCSMADLFHKAVPTSYVAKVFAVMALSGQHTFMVLTKRHGRLRSLLRSTSFRWLVWHAMLDITHDQRMPMPAPHRDRLAWPLPNVWVGVSVEHQSAADLRIPALASTPAAVRFLSCEPLLGPVDLESAMASRPSGPARPLGEIIDWVICGGESGTQARPMHPHWARSLRDQCLKAKIPFHFKQWGSWVAHSRPGDPWSDRSPDAWVSADDGATVTEGDAMADETGRFYCGMYRVGKKVAGRELDGTTWDQSPTPRAPIIG